MKSLKAGLFSVFLTLFLPNTYFPMTGFAERMHMWSFFLSLFPSIISRLFKSETKSFENPLRSVVSRSLHFLVSNGRLHAHKCAILAVSTLEGVGDYFVVQRVNTIIVRP